MARRAQYDKLEVLIVKKWYILATTSPEGLESILKISHNREEALTSAKSLLATVRPFFPMAFKECLVEENEEAIDRLNAALEAIGFEYSYLGLPLDYEYGHDRNTARLSLDDLRIIPLTQKGDFIGRADYDESLLLHDELVEFASSLGEDWFV